YLVEFIPLYPRAYERRAGVAIDSAYMLHAADCSELFVPEGVGLRVMWNYIAVGLNCMAPKSQRPVKTHVRGARASVGAERWTDTKPLPPQWKLLFTYFAHKS